MFNETYMVAVTLGNLIYHQSKPYRQKAAAIREFNRLSEGRFALPVGAEIKILKAQWVDSGLDSGLDVD